MKDVSYFRLHEQARGYVLDDQGRIRQHMVLFIDGDQARDRDRLSDHVSKMESSTSYRHYLEDKKS